MATSAPAGAAILDHPDFRAAAHSTSWVENTLDLGEIEPTGDGPGEEGTGAAMRRETTVEVDGRRFTVGVWVPDTTSSARPRRSNTGRPVGRSGDGEVVAPMQGTIVKVLISAGDTVEAGQAVCVLEAMKMENHVAAEKSGTVAEVRVSSGSSVGAGDIQAVIE